MAAPSDCGGVGESVVMVHLADNTAQELEKLNSQDRDNRHEDEENTTFDNPSNASVCRNETVCLPCLGFRQWLEACWGVSGQHILVGCKWILLAAFLVYVGFAFRHSFGDEQSVRLLVCAAVVVLVVAYKLCRRCVCGGNRREKSGFVRDCVHPFRVFYARNAAVIDGCLVGAVVIAVIVFLIVDVALRRPAHLVSAAGVAVLVTLMFLASRDPSKVVWRPVCWGLLLQFVFALLVLRTWWGRSAFNWLSARMTEYMAHTDSGSKFVFGDGFREHFFAFRVMPTIIFFSATITILYYLGVMQVIIRALAKVMHATMATGAMETFHAAVNIFCGWGTGLVDAASLGAVAALGVVAHIVATVIAFISLLGFVNATLEWLGGRVGLTPPLYPPLTFQLICSYLLWPLAFLLGIVPQDCRVVARLLGIKIFINEFIAYSDLGHVRANRLTLEDHVANNGTWRLVDSEGGIELIGTNTTLAGGVISARSEMLATYALCGFSDLVALGIMSAALSTVAPSRRQDILQVAPRALVSGVVACLLTAAMAGLVSED